MMNYSDSHAGRLPPAVKVGPDGKPLYSWRVLILPYIDEAALYNSFHLDEPWDSPHNRPLLAMIPKTYIDPGRPQDSTGSTSYQVFDGPGAPFDSYSRKDLQPFMLQSPKGALNLQMSPIQTRFPMGFTDGASNTFLIVEAGEPVPWSSPKDLQYDAARPLPKLGSSTRHGFNVAFADCSVRLMPETISEWHLRAYITPNGGEILGPDAP